MCEFGPADSDLERFYDAVDVEAKLLRREILPEALNRYSLFKFGKPAPTGYADQVRAKNFRWIEKDLIDVHKIGIEASALNRREVFRSEQVRVRCSTCTYV